MHTSSHITMNALHGESTSNINPVNKAQDYGHTDEADGTGQDKKTVEITDVNDALDLGLHRRRKTTPFSFAGC